MSNRNKKRGGCCLPNFLGCCLGIVLLLVCILGIPGLAISYATSGGPEPLDESFEPSAEEATRYEDAFSRAIQQARDTGAGNSFSVSFTENQFASWLNLEFKEELAKELGLEQLADELEFQAEFEDGVVKIFAGLVIWDSVGLDINSLATLTIAPTPADAPATQKLDVTITDFQIARAEATDGLKDDMTVAIDDAMVDLLKPIQDRQGFDYRITAVSIDNGLITFSGEVYPIQ